MVIYNERCAPSQVDIDVNIKTCSLFSGGSELVLVFTCVQWLYLTERISLLAHANRQMSVFGGGGERVLMFPIMQQVCLTECTSLHKHANSSIWWW